MLNWAFYYAALQWLFRSMRYQLFRPFIRRTEARLEKNALKAAKRNSPVMVTVSSRGGMRQGVYVNGVRVYVGTETTMVMTKAREVVKRLTDQGFQVISDLGQRKSRLLD